MDMFVCTCVFMGEHIYTFDIYIFANIYISKFNKFLRQLMKTLFKPIYYIVNNVGALPYLIYGAGVPISQLLCMLVDHSSTLHSYPEK